MSQVEPTWLHATLNPFTAKLAEGVVKYQLQFPDADLGTTNEGPTLCSVLVSALQLHDVTVLVVEEDDETDGVLGNQQEPLHTLRALDVHDQPRLAPRGDVYLGVFVFQLCADETPKFSCFERNLFVVKGVSLQCTEFCEGLLGCWSVALCVLCIGDVEEQEVHAPSHGSVS